MLNVSDMFFINEWQKREIPVTPPEREVQLCYYSPSIFTPPPKPPPPLK